MHCLNFVPNNFCDHIYMSKSSSENTFPVRQFVMKSYLTNDTSFMTEHEVMK